jgi:voltage-gated potassium channel
MSAERGQPAQQAPAAHVFFHSAGLIMQPTGEEDSSDPAPHPQTHHQHQMGWPLTLLFVTLLLVFVYVPMDMELPISLFALMFSGILLATILAVRSERNLLIGAIVLALASVLSSWTVTFLPHPPFALEVTTQAAAAAFVIYTIVALLNRIVHQHAVNIHTISAALSIYLLVGIFFGLVYTIIEMVWPGALGSTADSLRTLTRAVDLFPFLLYFSFMTLTTLGLGDIYPVLPMARSMAILEAIAGQIYLVVMMALLVSTFAAQRAERKQ